jgi:peptidoglycan/xylan/chitin deacetylase (PgdA/CDA1 family)
MYHGFHARDEVWQGSPGQRSYSVPLEEFDSHLRAIEQGLGVAPSTCWQLGQDQRPDRSWALTFDDGLESALGASEIVESLGWRAHFFIVTGSVGRPGFMTREQVRDLHARGHIVGSHSVSHPDPMSRLSYAKLLEEWRCSGEALGDVLGQPVRVASVPGGSLSYEVVAASVEAGNEVLFTSEPTSRIYRMQGCLLVGRYAIKNGHGARTAAALAAGKPLACGLQWAGWNTRKAAKRVLGSGYYSLRARTLDRLTRK